LQTHGLESSTEISKQELFKILLENLKAAKIEPDPDLRKEKVGS
jgi:hypothetical protein